MKKLFLLIAVVVAAFSFQSCEDEHIAHTLEGTWEGNMHITSHYNGKSYTSTKTKICFEIDPFKFKSGRGYWIDYYNDAPWSTDYVANHIKWSVSDRIIYIEFIEDQNSLTIENYSLNDNVFHGIIYDGENRVTFDMVHTSSPNWNRDFEYWGWNSYYNAKGYDKANAPKPIRKVTPPNQ